MDSNVFVGRQITKYQREITNQQRKIVLFMLSFYTLDTNRSIVFLIKTIIHFKNRRGVGYFHFGRENPFSKQLFIKFVKSSTTSG